MHEDAIGTQGAWDNDEDEIKAKLKEQSKKQ